MSEHQHVTHTEEAAWFQGSEGRSEDQRRFLAALRHHASEWPLPDFLPEDRTLAHGWAAIAVVELVVPGLQSAPVDVLEVVYDDHPGQSLLTGTWGQSKYPLDGPAPHPQEDLYVGGLRADPETYASWASEWLLHQLRRPLVRRDWAQGGLAVASTWQLPDTGRILARTGISIRRRLRRSPSREVRLR